MHNDNASSDSTVTSDMIKAGAQAYMDAHDGDEDDLTNPAALAAAYCAMRALEANTAAKTESTEPGLRRDDEAIEGALRHFLNRPDDRPKDLLEWRHVEVLSRQIDRLRSEIDDVYLLRAELDAATRDLDAAEKGIYEAGREKGFEEGMREMRYGGF